MSLPWIRLEASFPTNHKVLDLTTRGKYRAAFVYTCSLAHCGAAETDGYIRRAALPFIHARLADARDLVDVGLWQEFGEGWIIPDWTDYQPSSVATRESRERMREGGRRAVCARWMKDGKGCTCGQH